MKDTTTKINVFIAYAREDATYLEELRKHLRILELNGQVGKIWYDGEITAGQEREKAIKKAMETADIFLLLLSADFIYSDYCIGVEMQEALARHEAGTSTIIPVVVRDCGWNHIKSLSKIQDPLSGQAIAGNTYKDALYKGIVDAIAKVAKTTRERKKMEAPKPKAHKAKPIKLTKKQNKEDIKELLLDKILFLQKERILATNASVKFKLAHEIAELEQELDIFQNLQESNKISAEYLSFSKENQYKKSNHINNLQNIQPNRNKTVLPETYKYEIRGDSVIYWHPDGRETRLSLINSASGTVMSNRNSKVSKLKRSGERARIKLESWIKLFDKILKEYNSK